MIVAERKPIAEIKQMLLPYKKILIAGCGTCVAVCMAGGEKEVGIIATLLRMTFKMEGKTVEIGEVTVERQCDKEFIQPLADKIKEYEAILSTACGVGVQFMAEHYETLPVFPALNTKFMGSNEGEGYWKERCRACNVCVLGDTGGICPITICPKGLLNGPCGGTNKGKCEVDKEKDCAWTLIYRKCERLNLLDKIREIFPPRRYSLSTHPGKLYHEAYLKEEEK